MTRPSAFDCDGDCFSSNGQLPAVTTGKLLQDNALFKAGLIIAIEPMTTQGRKDVHSREDGWTIVTRDGKPAAHYEHSIAITKGGAPADLMSDHRPIEAAIRNNPNLKVVANLDEELVARYQPVTSEVQG